MRILLIEDDQALCRSLKLSLENQGYVTDVCHDGEEGLYYILEGGHDLILLDRMLPGIDGIEVLKRARKKDCTVPVIFLTALGSLEERITGLNIGADDYIVKPFAFEELLARIRCVCRRPRQLQASKSIVFGDLSFDPDQSLLTCGDRSSTLSRREGELLAIFLNHAEQTLPRSLLLSRVWGADSEIESGNLDNYIHFLRRRLKGVNSRVQLKTIRGIGYRIHSETEAYDK